MTPWEKHGPLKVSENRRFLVHRDGTPFFYLGDTAWELFHRLTREEAADYLKDRAGKGYTVIQAVALAEFNGLDAPNAYGHFPLLDRDPARPDLQDGPGNDYWDHVDFIVGAAAEQGLIIGFLPTWGDKWQGQDAVFTSENAGIYGEWLGKRYRDKPLIWILGGDRNIENETHRAIIAAMAAGLRKGDGGSHLVTFHPRGGAGSSQWFHSESWLDFNMRQNGHSVEFDGAYENTRADYDLQPPKPVLDGEPVYEDHPVSFNMTRHGHSLAIDTRHALYWDLFGGAFGHSYGHHSIWQMYDPEKRQPHNHPLLPWREALDQPGSAQMQYGRQLIESRPFLTRIPDDALLVADKVPTSVPGAGRYRFSATRDEEGTYAMIYVPAGRPFTVNTALLPAGTLSAWWFNPRDGGAQKIGSIENRGRQRFVPPAPGEDVDWVLVLDDPSKNYPPPGTRP